MIPRLEDDVNNKESAIAFLKMAGTGQVDEAFETFVAPGFIHHNQYFKGDRDSLKQAMAMAHEKSPNKLVDVKRAFEDGDYVITHSRVARQDPTEPDISVVHIFRFAAGKVAEIWDVGQMLSKDSPNENGAF
jgi:predicted SnoaL-like aldol condensation-catalyzing enzyme